MKMNDIHAFVVVAEKKNFTRAAEALFITQPALSRKIRDLEKALNCRLFERNTRKVKLTLAGETLYRHAKIADRELCEAEAEIEELIHKPAQILRIGYTPVSGRQTLLLDALNYACEKYPGIEFKLRRAYVESLVEQLREGRLDCSLISDTRAIEEGLEYEAVYPISRYVVLSRKHPLAREKSVSFEQIAREPRIMLSASLAPYHVKSIEEADKRLGIEPNITAEARDVEELLMYVWMGKGIGILTGSLSMDDRVVSIPIHAGFPVRTRTVAWVKGRKTALVDRLIESIKAVVREDNGADL